MGSGDADSFVPAYQDVSKLDYCVQSHAATHLRQLPCVSFDPLRYSSATTDLGLLVGTRVKRQLQPRNYASTFRSDSTST